MHLEVLVEDASGATALEILLPRILGSDGPHTWQVIAYKGIGRLPPGLRANSHPSARALLNRLPSLLQGYGNAFAGQAVAQAVVVVCDLDRRCLKEFRNELNAVLSQCRPQPTTGFCIAVQELESWYLGDPQALLQVRPSRTVGKLKPLRDETVDGNWERLADMIHPGGAAALRNEGVHAIGRQKQVWAEQLCPLLDLERNRSPSFQYFLTVLRRLTAG